MPGMASVYQHHPTQLWGSHYRPNANAGVSTGVSLGMNLTERSREYDQGLKASQMIKSGFPLPARNMEDVQESVTVGMDMAQTAILRDSEDTTTLPSKGAGKPGVDLRSFGTKGKGKATAVGDGEEGAGEDISEFGDSYVDGAVRRPKSLGQSQSQQQEEEEDDELLADGGVLGLLAQIYGRKDRTGL